MLKKLCHSNRAFAQIKLFETRRASGKSENKKSVTFKESDDKKKTI